MKHFTLITSLLSTLLLFNSNADAQTTYESRFSMGASIGTGHSWIRNTPWLPVVDKNVWDSNMDAAYKPSWSAGFSTIFHATQHFGIGMDVLYSIEGDRSTGGPVTVQLDLQYFRVPLRFMYFFGNSSDNFRPQVSVGATAGLKTGASGAIMASDRKMLDIDVDNAYKSFDYGVNASVGFNQKIAGRISVNADIVYYQALCNIEQGGDLYGNAMLNSNLGLQFGVMFGL